MVAVLTRRRFSTPGDDVEESLPSYIEAVFIKEELFMDLRKQ